MKQINLLNLKSKIKCFILDSNYFIMAVVCALISWNYTSLFLYEMEKARCSLTDSAIVYSIVAFEFLDTASFFANSAVFFAVVWLVIRIYNSYHPKVV